jgi:hypothetical protein
MCYNWFVNEGAVLLDIPAVRVGRRDDW